MKATISSEPVKHFPVLLKELISIISPQYGGTFIDCTFGQAGYTNKILEFPDTKVIALDRDKQCENKAKLLSKKFDERFFFKNLRFSQLSNLKLKNENIKTVIFDLGYSLNQIKDKKKGLSFYSTGKLNMQMGLNDFSAHEVINKLAKDELVKIFKFYGEEKESKKIVKNIILERKKKFLETQDLVRIINYSKKNKNFRINNSTKVFQALRIFVNKEISELINGLIIASKVLKKNGILAVVTFHSIEDKIVKYFFKSLSEKKGVSRYMPEINTDSTIFELKKKKPILPSKEEILKNPPSRTAKLRYVIKKIDTYEFKTDVKDKFKDLLDIENFSKKL